MEANKTSQPNIQPDISVIIPAYNSAIFIESAIESVQKQVRTLEDSQSLINIEIIIVDDGSTDNTQDVLKQYATDPDIKIFFQENAGPGAARNLGVSHAHAPIICFLDADDQLKSTSLIKRFEVLQKHPEIDLVFTEMIRIKDPKTTGIIFHQANEFLTKFQPAIAYSQNPLYFFNDQYLRLALKYFPFILTSTVMLRKSIIHQLGGFNTHWHGSEDIDLWYRIMQHGKIAYINEPLTEWHTHRSFLTRDGNTRFYTDTIKCYRALKLQLSTHRTLQSLIKQKMAHFAFCGGYESMETHQLKAARRFFAQACYFEPMKIKHWIYALLCFLPSGLFYPLKRCKQMLSQ